MTLKPGWLGELDPLHWEWAVGRLEAERNFWLTSIRRDGFPQARPVWGLWDEDGLYLSVGGGGLSRAEAGDALPVTAHTESAANVVIIEGHLQVVARPGAEQGLRLPEDRLRRMLDAWNAKYDKCWTEDKHGFNRVVRPSVVLAWRERADRTDADASGKWVFD